MKTVIKHVERPELLKYLYGHYLHLYDHYLKRYNNAYDKKDDVLTHKSFIKALKDKSVELINSTQPLDPSYIKMLNCYYRIHQNIVNRIKSDDGVTMPRYPLVISIVAILCFGLMRVFFGMTTKSDAIPVLNIILMVISAAIVASIVGIIILCNLPVKDLPVVEEMKKQQQSAPPAYSVKDTHKTQQVDSAIEPPPAYSKIDQIQITHQEYKEQNHGCAPPPYQKDDPAGNVKPPAYEVECPQTEQCTPAPNHRR